MNILLDCIPCDGVAEKLPFEDHFFDFALMVTTICFLDNVKQAAERPGVSSNQEVN